MSVPKEVIAFCRMLQVEPKTLMDYRVYPGEKVVVILENGPKHVHKLPLPRASKPKKVTVSGKVSSEKRRS